jgi:hypothetical protein
MILKRIVVPHTQNDAIWNPDLFINISFPATMVIKVARFNKKFGVMSKLKWYIVIVRQ